MSMYTVIQPKVWTVWINFKKSYVRKNRKVLKTLIYQGFSLYHFDTMFLSILSCITLYHIDIMYKLSVISINTTF